MMCPIGSAELNTEPPNKADADTGTSLTILGARPWKAPRALELQGFVLWCLPKANMNAFQAYGLFGPLSPNAVI